MTVIGTFLIVCLEIFSFSIKLVIAAYCALYVFCRPQFFRLMAVAGSDFRIFHFRLSTVDEAQIGRDAISN